MKIHMDCACLTYGKQSFVVVIILLIIQKLNFDKLYLHRANLCEQYYLCLNNICIIIDIINNYLNSLLQAKSLGKFIIVDY